MEDKERILPKIELINPFLSATYVVLTNVVGKPPTKGEISMLPSVCPTSQINVACSIEGDIVGDVIFGMSLTTADRVASTALSQPVKTFDATAANVITRLVRRIGDRGLAELVKAGLFCSMSGPAVIKGTAVEVTRLAIPALVVPFQLEQGEFIVTIGLQRAA